MRRNLLLSLATLLAVAVVLEAGLRFYDVARGGSFFRTHGNQLAIPFKRVIPFRVFGFNPYRNGNPPGVDTRHIVSRWGETFPYRKKPGAIRIVCFGGSTTESRPELNYPAMLQAMLRARTGRQDIEVINVGHSAYTTAHSLILLEFDVISWQPDLVILSHNINDLMVMYWPTFRPDYWNKYAHEYYTTPDYGSLYTWPNLTFQHSRLYWFIKEQIAAIQETDAPSAESLRRRSYGNAPLPEAAATFQRNLQTFVGIARQHGIPVLLASQPHQPDEDLFLEHWGRKPYNDLVVYPLHTEFVRHHHAYNRVIAEVAAANGVGFLDNDGRLGGDRRYFRDNVHYTPAGLQRLASGYADYILGQHAGAAPAQPPPGR